MVPARSSTSDWQGKPSFGSPPSKKANSTAFSVDSKMRKRKERSLAAASAPSSSVHLNRLPLRSTTTAPIYTVWPWWFCCFLALSRQRTSKRRFSKIPGRETSKEWRFLWNSKAYSSSAWAHRTREPLCVKFRTAWNSLWGSIRWWNSWLLTARLRTLTRMGVSFSLWTTSKKEGRGSRWWRWNCAAETQKAGAAGLIN